MRHGLTLAGRYLVVRTRIGDRPGELIKLLSLFAEEHANVVSVEHHREGMNVPVTETEVEATLLTRDQEHCDAPLAAMRARGYVVESPLRCRRARSAAARTRTTHGSARLAGRRSWASASRSSEERKVVSVLFADLVGFTSRAERMDPEDVRAVLEPYHARLRRARAARRDG